ncbi:hypothetical protein V5F34_12360 [Xanthobacter autotrophicus]|uniref:Uncharacterized protein n=1 Tax=Xanthobacter autotrophicus TaxID=280 RepID=A0A6C1KSJ2_XANAU|nr:hypothetical protein [Xanthobacter autotrophicus]TLX41663.1 hypothetical protein FBQ73_16190 [Xanthobacter autotrophicus]
MIVASEFASRSLEEIKELLAGGTLTVYSVARPVTADHAVDRSGKLVAFTFATPAFGTPSEDGSEVASFVADVVNASDVGTPGFARAVTADGKVVADFSAGPGDREIKFSEVSFSANAPVKVVKFKFNPEGGWPERVDYYDAHPRPGYSLPKVR